MSGTNIVDIHAVRPRRTRRAAKPPPAAGTPGLRMFVQVTASVADFCTGQCECTVRYPARRRRRRPAASGQVQALIRYG